jgi:RHS repeat-associated protein
MAFDIVRLLDGTGQVVAAREYDAFGNIRTQTGDWTISDLGFHSDWVMIPNTGGTLYFTPGGRAYDTTLGRFLQRDPLAAGTSSNSYVALNNAPTNYVDPLGFATKNIGDCDMYNIVSGSYPALPAPYAGYVSSLSVELLMCLAFMESSFNPNAGSSSGAYGLTQIDQRTADQIDKVYGWPTGTTWQMIQSGDPYAQITAAMEYLAWLLGRTQGDLSQALQRYGPRDVGNGYAQMLLDCQKCLKESNALDECSYLLSKTPPNKPCPKPGNMGACFSQMTARTNAVAQQNKTYNKTHKVHHGRLWGYRELYPEGFVVPPPFVAPMKEVQVP